LYRRAVQTLHATARLLAAADSLPALAAVAAACGFHADPLPLDARARRDLGLTDAIRRANVIAGPGVLRALCVEVPTGSCTADAVATLAITVQRRSPFALWLVLVTERGGSGCALATAQLSPAPRAALLVVDRRHVVDSDAETLRALAAAADGVDLLVHVRWHELLGREALTQRFFRALETAVDTMAASLPASVPPAAARTIALLTATRLLFLSFLEAKGWLDGDHAFLRRTWDECTAGRGRYHATVLAPLFFGTLNTPVRDRAARARKFGRVPFLNGGLFTRTPLEREHAGAFIADAALGTLIGTVLSKWRFTVREEQSSQSEAAVDPEMLGRAFESLMASPERRATGSFYTPPVLVSRVADAAFAAACDGDDVREAFAAVVRGEPVTGDAAGCLRAHLASLTVLDPACGSGAFLVHALESLARWRSLCGDARDAGALRRDILTRQIFGVDRHSTAVWLCELRLWLAVVVETTTTDPYAVPPLPNLDAQVRVGDALAGTAFAESAVTRAAHPLRWVRERYARASGGRKRTLQRALARAERRAAIDALEARIASVRAKRRDVVTAARGRDLWGARAKPDAATRERIAVLGNESRALRREVQALQKGSAVPFDFAAQFADVGARGGFDVIVGNPPWVRLHHIPPLERARLRTRYRVYRDAAWRAGAAIAGAGTGFAAQVDLAALFVERSLALLKPQGTLALLVPTKLWRSLAGAGVRDLLLTEATVRELDDWSEATATFDAAVYPSVVVASRGADSSAPPISVGERRRDTAVVWATSPRALPFDDTTGAPWIWLPPEVRDGFALVRDAGIPLGLHDGLRPRLGVKCGCNDAFIAAAAEGGALRARDGHTATVEPHLVRALLRGDAVTPWRIAAGNERIIVPHDDTLAPLTSLPPRAKYWLTRWRSALTARTDYRGVGPWWALNRTDAADPRTPRVVWADMARVPRAAVLAAGDRTVPLNTCYVVPTATLMEAYALAAWLNGPLAAAWLSALAEPARGGYRRLLGWTMALLPLPRDWSRALPLLAPLGASGAADDPPHQDELLEAALAALDITREQVEPLLAWGHRPCR
jgi:hypothetical protein